MRYVIRKEGDVSTIGVHRNSFDEALEIASQMIETRADNKTITLEDTWENRQIDEAEIRALFESRTPPGTEPPGR